MKYTVALLRPQRFIDAGFTGFNRREDLGYLAQVEADSCSAAIIAARKEVCKADRRDLREQTVDRFLPAVQQKEYTLLWVFAGYHSAIAYGFEETP